MNDNDIILVGKKQIMLFFQYGWNRGIPIVSGENYPIHIRGDGRGYNHFLLGRQGYKTVALVGKGAVRVRAGSNYAELFKEMAFKYDYRYYEVEGDWVNRAYANDKLHGPNPLPGSKPLQDTSTIELDGKIYAFPSWEEVK